MQLPGMVGRAWRMLGETDLEAIRIAAERPFRLLIWSAAPAHGLALAGALQGSWPAGPPLQLASDPGFLPAPGTLDAVIAIGPDPALEQSLGGLGVPVLKLTIGPPAPSPRGWLAVPALDASALPAVAAGLVSLLEGDLRLALARSFPALRGAVFPRLIEEVARANAAYAFSTALAEAIPVLDLPLNLADILVLTKNQWLMSYRIALAAGKEGTPRALLGEVLGVMGSGFLLRQASRSLVGLVPVIGIAPKVVVAYAGTVAIGRAVSLWATEGHRLSPKALRQLYREARKAAPAQLPAAPAPPALPG